MNRIKNAFQKGKAFIGFLTAGDPSIEHSEEFILSMAAKGVDLIEIGIPFSDPVAEGKVIEAANVRALATGTTTDSVFELVRRVRSKTDVPLVFLTYLNPVFQYGYERFFATAKEAGLDGIIIPDLPYEEKAELLPFAKKNDIHVISLIAPTSQDRIKQIAKEAEGFIYLVSSMGVTGVRSQIHTDLSSIIQTIRSVSDTPIAVGFGISTPKQAAAIAEIADGVIVGSALVKIIEHYGRDSAEPIEEYVRLMKAAVTFS